MMLLEGRGQIKGVTRKQIYFVASLTGSSARGFISRRRVQWLCAKGLSFFVRRL
jgi:hypothetical protein